MKKILIGGFILVVIVAGVYFITEHTANKKASGIADGMIQNIPGVIGWDKKANSYNFFTKNLIYNDLVISFSDNSSLKFGKISAGQIDEERKTISSLLFENINYTKDNESVLHIDKVVVNHLPYAVLAGADWKKIGEGVALSSVLMGFWTAPFMIFDNLTATGLQHNRNHYSIHIASLSIEVNASLDKTFYLTQMDAIGLLSHSGIEMLRIDNVTNHKIHNRAQRVFSETYEAQTKDLASFHLSYSINDFDPDTVTSAIQPDTFFSNLSPSELTIIFRNEALLQNIYELIGIFTGYGNESAKILLINAAKDHFTALGASAELVNAIALFMAQPESIELRKTSGEAFLSVNGAAPIEIGKIASPAQTIPEEHPFSYPPAGSEELMEYELN